MLCNFITLLSAKLDVHIYFILPTYTTNNKLALYTLQEGGFILKKFSIIGTFFVILLGTFLHFAYELSDGNAFVALFTPISESIWEHFKLGFYSLIIYALIAYLFVKKKANNYLFATGVSSIILNLIITLLYYAYNIFTDKSIIWLDISIYILAVAIAFFIFYKLTTRPPLPTITKWIGLIIILFTISAFIAFTLNPPNQFDLFIDHTKS